MLDLREGGERLEKKDLKPVGRFAVHLLLTGIFLYVMFGVMFGIQPMADEDMAPRISAGDLMLYFRREDVLRPGDVLVFDTDEGRKAGRIAACGGDCVDFTEDGSLSVNGSIVVESGIYGKTFKVDNDRTYPLVLEEDTYFVLGDQRERAKDSRTFGAVERQKIKGKVILLLKRNGL